MAKKYIIYAGGKDLASHPVTQNEIGVYYWNGSTYYKPILADFDNAGLPSGFKKYIGGSHAVYQGNPNRHPIDLSIAAGVVMTANFDFYVRGFTLADGSWCKGQIAGTSNMLGFVHTYQWAALGLVPAGQPICRIAPQSVTGFAPHLHMDEWTGYKIRDLILNGEFKMSSTLKVGDKVRIMGGDMNLRVGAGTGFTNNVRTLKQGAVVQIKDGIRTSQNVLFYGKGSTLNVNDTYQWIDVVDADGVTGWIAITNRVELVHGNTALTKIDGSSPVAPPVPPVVDPTLELKKRIDTLTLENEGLRNDLRALQENNVELQALVKDKVSRITELEEDLKVERAEREELGINLGTLQTLYDNLHIEKNRIENERNHFEEENSKLKSQLSEGNKNFIKKITDWVAEILAKITSSGE